MHLMLSKLRYVWFSNAIARLTQFGWPKGVEIRWRPYMVRAGDGCKIRRFGGEVLIALVSVLAAMLLAIIYAVAYTYSR